MKLRCVSLALLAAVLVSTVAGHPLCNYRAITLTIALDEEACAEACKNFSSKRYDTCFGYVYNARYESCSGYVFDRSDDYGSYQTCGPNYGVNLTLPTDSDEAPGSQFGPEGCDLYQRDLGIKLSEADCIDSCKNLESNYYGGCAAWLYNPETEECAGILSEESYERSICGSIQP